MLRPSQGTWKPGMPQDVGGWILVIFTTQMLMRGADYLLGDDPSVTTSLTVVEQALPLWTWGGMLITAAVLIYAGVALHRARPIIVGAILGMATYGGLAVGFALQVIERGWPWDGWRTATAMLFAGAFWGLIAYGTHVMMRARSADTEEE